VWVIRLAHFMYSLVVMVCHNVNIQSPPCLTQKVSPPMPLWTKTSRWRERVKVNSEVEVRQTASLVHRPKWYKAVVMALSDNPKEITGGAELELIDEDASGKKIPLKLLRRKRQVLLKVHQERNNCATPAPAKIMYENGMPVVHPPFIR
jgi:hypothetical protein